MRDKRVKSKFLLLMLLCSSLASCGDSSSKSDTETKSNDTSQAVQVTRGEHTLALSVLGVRNDRGNIIASMCIEGQAFPSECSFVARSPASKGSVEINFKDLAPANYAIAVFHDENADEELTFIQEGIGFSNDSNKEFAAPKFKSAAIKVDASNGETAINIRYFN